MIRILLILASLQLVFGAKQPYNEWIAAKMANLSAAAYFSSEISGLECTKCYPSFQVDQVIENTGLLAIVGYEPDLNSVVVIFRGTINLLNAIIDVNVVPTPYLRQIKCPLCSVHGGFVTSYVSLYSDGLKVALLDALDKHKGANIIFTGHSLGGAIANYASLRF